MNAPVLSTPNLPGSAREIARAFDREGRGGVAVMIRLLVSEIEDLREAAQGSLVIVNQAVTDKNLATLKASTLLIVAEKIAPVIDEEIEQRKHGGNEEDWALLQALSDELHAAIRLVKS